MYINAVASPRQLLGRAYQVSITATFRAFPSAQQTRVSLVNTDMKKIPGRGVKVSPWLTLFIGYVLGYVLYPVLQMWTCRCDTYGHLDVPVEAAHFTTLENGVGQGAAFRVSREEFVPRYLHPSASWLRPQKLGRPRTLAGEYQVRKKLFVAVITAEKYLPTRARAVYETWGSSVTQVSFFVGADCNTSHPDIQHLPIVKLPGIPDTVYPPQKKVFAVLDYIHDHYLDKFHWFMRADDDVYVRGEKLEGLLDTLNSNEKVYLGLAGKGKTEDVKRLGLRPHERYCMGGPGVIFSNAALKALAPYLDHCLSAVDEYNEVYPTNPWYNEDVELGRCVSRTINIQCSTSAEGRSYFIQDYTSAALHPHTLWHNPALRDLITLHPIKQPQNLYAVHHFYEVARAQAVQNELQKLQNTINSMCSKMPDSLTPPWQTMRSCTVQLCSGAWQQVGVATHSTPFTMATKLPKVYNPESLYELTPWEHFSTSTKHDITGISPEHGLYGHFESEIAGMVSLVGHHVNTELDDDAAELRPVEVVQGYARFSAEVGREYVIDVKFAEVSNSSSLHTKRVRLLRPLSKDIMMIAEDSGVSTTVVNVVVPVLEAGKSFLQFMWWYERASLHSKQKTHLILSVIGDSSTLHSAQVAVANYTMHHPGVRATVLSGTKDLSPLGALELGISVLGSHDLVFMADTRLRLRPLFFHSCQRNTAEGKRVYYPVPYVVFSEPDTASGPGRWGFYSYSALCIYKSDFLPVSDSFRQLFQHVSQSSLELFQAPDPSLVRVAQPETCDEMTGGERQLLCQDLTESRQLEAGLVEYLYNHDTASHRSLAFTEEPA